MRILFITEYLPPHICGISTRCYNYIVNLRKMNHTVYVYSLKESELSCVSMTEIPCLFLPNTFLFHNIETITHLMNIIDTIDIIHIFCPCNVTNIPLFPIFYEKRIPLICSHHCDLSMTKMLGILENPMKFILEEYHANIFTTKYVTKNLAPSKFKAKDMEFEIIPSGIDDTIFTHSNVNFNKRSTSKQLVYVGRLSKEKNVDMLLDFFKQLTDIPKYKAYKLIIIGDGPHRQELENMVNIKNVVFTGQMEPEHVSEYYKKCQAFVTFSLSETFGLTNLEAIACGAHCIYPACKVFDELYKDTFPNTRFDISNFETFRNAVDYSYKTNDTAKMKHYVSDKGWYSTTKKLVDIYEDTIANAKFE